MQDLDKGFSPIRRLVVEMSGLRRKRLSPLWQ